MLASKILPSTKINKSNKFEIFVDDEFDNKKEKKSISK